MRYSRNSGLWLKTHFLWRFDKILLNSSPRLPLAQEVLLVGSLVVAVPGREHHALDAEVGHLVEERPDALGVGALEQGRVGRDAEAPLHCLPDALDGHVVRPLPADGEVVVVLLPVHVDAEREVLARLELVELGLEQQRVRAEVDVLLAGHQPLDDLLDVRVQQRLAAGDGDHRGPALVDGLEAVGRRQLLLQHVGRVLDLPAPGAGQVAAEQRLQHQHQRVVLVAAELLAEHVAGHGPHLRDRYGHKTLLS